ncbi:hypothetical protein STIAU_0151, partial [Stigmatella aurantiaca DW4/3-1]
MAELKRVAASGCWSRNSKSGTWCVSSKAVRPVRTFSARVLHA